jgi:hypothetical protein
MSIHGGHVTANGTTGIGTGFSSQVRRISVSNATIEAITTGRGSGIGGNLDRIVLEDVSLEARSSNATGILGSGSVSLFGNVSLICESVGFCVDSPSIILNVSSLLMTTNRPRLFGKSPAVANLTSFSVFYEVLSEREPVNKSLLHFSNISFVNYTQYNFEVTSSKREFHVPMNSSAYRGFLVYVEGPTTSPSATLRNPAGWRTQTAEYSQSTTPTEYSMQLS